MRLGRLFWDPLWWHGVSSRLVQRDYTRFARFVDYFVRWWFGCFIPGTAVIGSNSSVGYGGIGVVIHKDAILGSFVNVGPNVVIGGNGIGPGVPRIGSHVVIGAGAKILGPITVGDHVRVGANAVVISDIPNHSLAVGVPAKARPR